MRALERRPLMVWFIVAALALVFVCLIVAAPLALSNNYVSFAGATYQAFSHLCHQIPERSFHIAGHALAVCARCTGLYAGFAVGALLYPLARSLRISVVPARVWLLIAAVPVMVDFALDFFGVWENTHSSRFVTGALLGAVSAFYVVPGLIDLSRIDWRRVFARSAVKLL